MDIKIPHEKSYKFIKNLNSSKERIDSIAIIDGDYTCTYKEMFKNWEDYAKAFSALGITEKNNSCVLVFSTATKESINIFYALNMTGAVCSFAEPHLDFGRVESIKKVIKVEKTTDLIIWDWAFTVDIIKQLVEAKEELGLRNIIIFHTEFPQLFSKVFLKPLNFRIKSKVKKIKGVIWLDEAIEKYSNHAIEYGSDDDSKLTLITHTSGTLKGVRKPIAFTDRNINALATEFIESKFDLPMKNAKSLFFIPPCTAYGAVNSMHLPLAMNCAVISLHLIFPMPKLFGKVLKIYKPNVILSNQYFWDHVMESKEAKKLDLSQLAYVGIGGSKVSPKKIKECNKFLQEHGSKIYVTNGYGLSETGGASITTVTKSENDSIGVPLPGVYVKVYDQDTNSYKGLSDAPVSGELFISSEAAVSGKLYENKILDPVLLDGRMYIPTGDSVRFETDGTITYIGRLGRAFQYFDQRNCQPELIEDDIKKVKGVKNCLVVPKYYSDKKGKLTLIYFEFDKSVKDEKKLIHDIIYYIFLSGTSIEVPQSLPKECVVVDEIPLNIMSKEEVHDIIEHGLEGKKFRIKKVGRIPYIKDIIIKE